MTIQYDRIVENITKYDRFYETLQSKTIAPNKNHLIDRKNCIVIEHYFVEKKNIYTFRVKENL